MPRKADAQLESRIVDAAYLLWSKGGEHALTMRAVAQAAKTTTPTLYERFRDKDDLIVFLRARARQRMFAAIQPAKSALEGCRLGLEFTLNNDNEYLLLTSDWAERLGRQEPMPSYEFLTNLLAKDLGGTPTSYKQVALSLVALVHGTAIMLAGEGIQPSIAQQFKDACMDGCERLIASSSKGSGQHPNN